jgi:hypothetical protein
MIVKTITCHDVYNMGASLQAYALVTYLQSLGHQAQIIDYKPEYLSRHYALDTVENPRYDKPLLRQAYLLAKLPGRMRARMSCRKKRFDEFRQAYLPLTRRYESYEELLQDPPMADVLFAGSDQIWNTQLYNGKDPAFYLAFANAFAKEHTVKASYAASFAMDQVDAAWAAQQRAWIQSLDYVSVRERTGLSILDQLGIEKGRVVMDPVFLLDADVWRSVAKPIPQGDPYLFVYDFDQNPDLEREAKALAKKRNCKIYSVMNAAYADRCLSDAGPLEFLGYLDGAQAVLSNSFHATAFSLIFHRPFLSFDRKEKLNSRMHDLLACVGLKSQDDAWNIDWMAVQQRLDQEVACSKAFIDEVLHGSV